MSVNIFISYILYNKDIIVNLYKLHFSSSHFSLQPNNKVFHSPTFPLLQPNTHEGKPNLFYPPTFPSSRFSTLPTKRTLKVVKILVTSIKFWGPIRTKPKCLVDTVHSHDQFGRNLNAGQQSNMNKTTNDTASSTKVSKDPFGWEYRKVRG